MRVAWLFLITVISVLPLMSQSQTPVYRGSTSPGGSVHSHFGAVTNNTSGTPVKINGTYNLTGLESSMSEPVDGRLQYTGAVTRTFIFVIHYSFSSDTNNTVITLAAAKNGVVVTDSLINSKIGAGADISTLSTSYMVSLSTNDYLEAFVDSDAGDPALTTQHITLMAWAIG